MEAFLRKAEMGDSTQPAILRPLDLQLAAPYVVAALAEMAEWLG
jgi:hypothetical protein